jgi:exopolysaccharide biosynthesis polyprenyl glycosylphosphotransferase
VALKEPEEQVIPRKRRWEHSYAARLFATDLASIVVAVFASQLIRFGGTPSGDDVAAGSNQFGIALGYSAVSIILAAAWMVSLDIFATRDHKIVGTGTTEYKRVVDATIRLFGVFAIVAFLTKIDLARGYLLLALPAGLLLLMFTRWAWRQWLVGQRRGGGYVHRVVLLGHRAKMEAIATNIQRESAWGLTVIGGITPTGTTSRELLPGVPVLGDFAHTVDVLEASGADALVLIGADDIGPRQMRELGWQLQDRSIDLIVAPALTGVAGPRIHARPVAGLPLIHVDYPTFEGRKNVAKRVFDVLVSGLLLVVLSPVFLICVWAIRRDSSGPAFFYQERVGIKGAPFSMIKFRSMVSDAEALLPSLLDQSEGNEVLFKMKADPRITRVGAFMRRYSLDELPQLVNVLRGEMSIVGPRPPLAREVEKYDNWAKRRLLVKPGITGLWQINGRSDLSWDDSMRLDLYYVENWSLTGDVIIMFRTVRAVVSAAGAY